MARCPDEPLLLLSPWDGAGAEALMAPDCQGPQVQLDAIWTTREWLLLLLWCKQMVCLVLTSEFSVVLVNFDRCPASASPGVSARAGYTFLKF